MQLIAVLVCVAAAVGYLAWRMARSWKSSRNGCGGGCGCASTPAAPAAHFIPSDQLVVRRSRAKS